MGQGKAKGRMTRRNFLKTSAALGAGVAFGGLLDGIYPQKAMAAKRHEGETLSVFTYAGSTGEMVQNYMKPRFEKETGAKMVIDLGWWDSIPKLKASPPGHPAFDLIMTDATQGYPAIKEGLFQKINMKNVPNVRNFTPEVLNNWVFNEDWGVTWPDTAQTGVYNKQFVKTPPGRWSDLLKKEFDHKLGMYNSFYMSLFTFACMKVDKEGEAGTAREEVAKNLEGVLQFAKEQKTRVNYWWPTSTDMAFNLLQGTVWAGNIHSSDIYGSVKEGKPVGVFVPDRDRAHVAALWVVPKETKKKELAEAAINIFCSEEFQFLYASRGGFPTAIPTVAQRVAKQDPVWALINPHTKTHFRNIGYYPYDVYFRNWDYIVNFWDKQILRK
jgi:putative spermidine/putrescine transport system substrate-binding protein